MSCSLNALSSDSIGTACTTSRELRDAMPPTRCVGESGIDEFGMRGLERLQLAHQRVELRRPRLPGRRGRNNGSCGGRSASRSSTGFVVAACRVASCLRLRPRRRCARIRALPRAADRGAAAQRRAALVGQPAAELRCQCAAVYDHFLDGFAPPPPGPAARRTVRRRILRGRHAPRDRTCPARAGSRR